MKSLFARLRRDDAARSPPSEFPPTTQVEAAALPDTPEDATAFQDTVGGDTAFQDTVEDADGYASWAERRQALGATPGDPVRCAALFEGLWGSDRWVAALSPAERTRLAQHLEFVQIGAGREVIGQDEQGDYMLILLDGRVALERVQSGGGRSSLGEARPGDMLGEMSLLDAGTRFCACTTRVPSLLAVLELGRLDALMRHEPRLGVALLAALSRRLSLRLRQISVRLSALTPRG